MQELIKLAEIAAAVPSTIPRIKRRHHAHRRGVNGCGKLFMLLLRTVSSFMPRDLSLFVPGGCVFMPGTRQPD